MSPPLASSVARHPQGRQCHHVQVHDHAPVSGRDDDSTHVSQCRTHGLCPISMLHYWPLRMPLVARMHSSLPISSCRMADSALRRHRRCAPFGTDWLGVHCVVLMPARGATPRYMHSSVSWYHRFCVSRTNAHPLCSMHKVHKLALLNVLLFIATDIKDTPMLAPLCVAFPCTFLLRDLSDVPEVRKLGHLISGEVGVRLGPFLVGSDWDVESWLSCPNYANCDKVPNRVKLMAHCDGKCPCNDKCN
jgi:hypothetical protein